MCIYIDNEGKKFLRTGRMTWALVSHASTTQRVSKNGEKRSTK